MVARELTPFSSVSVIYNLYLNLGVLGLRSLENYIVEDNVSPPFLHTTLKAKTLYDSILTKKKKKKRNGVKPTTEPTSPCSAPFSPAPLTS